MRILCNHGFYGLLLMHMIYSIDEGAETAYTDGERIDFGPKFLDDLLDNELDFVMMHEILPVVLQHCLMGEEWDQERYNIAADIVVNSNIMLENGGKPLIAVQFEVFTEEHYAGLNVAFVCKRINAAISQVLKIAGVDLHNAVIVCSAYCVGVKVAFLFCHGKSQGKGHIILLAAVIHSLLQFVVKRQPRHAFEALRGA